MTFLREPRRPSQPFLLLPWPVLVLIGLLATAYAAYTLAPPTLQNWVLAEYAFIPARYSDTFAAAFAATYGYLPGAVLERAVPFVSYIFLHGGLAHLAINCIWLLPFGTVAARRFGPALFYVFFLLCGIAGAGVHLAVNWGSTLPMIGASGAISGLMGAAFRLMRPTGEVPAASPARALAPLFSRRIVTWTAIWVAINVVAGVTGLGTGGGLIAWQVHLGGYFAGLILAGPFAAFAALHLEQSRTDNRLK